MGQFARTELERKAARKPERAIGHDDQSGLMALQRTVGNRAVTMLMGRGVLQRHPEVTANAEVEEAQATEPTAAVVNEAAETAESGTGTTGTTGKLGAGLKGDARKKSIENILRASATGMWALAIIEKWKIPIDYEAGPGSFHSEGKIYLDKTLGVGAVAQTIMHEAQHANTFKSGNAADIKALGREEYIKKKIADEAEAVVREIEGMAITRGLGVDMTGAGIGEDQRQRYLKAFSAKGEELRKADPTMTTAQINAICRTHVRDTEVTNWFHDGTLVTSGDKPLTYSDHYGSQWDDEHKPPAKK